jgi:hypothetical protein
MDHKAQWDQRQSTISQTQPEKSNKVAHVAVLAAYRSVQCRKVLWRTVRPYAAHCTDFTTPLNTTPRSKSCYRLHAETHNTCCAA